VHRRIGKANRAAVGEDSTMRQYLNGAAPRFSVDAVSVLARRIRGRVVRASDPDYDATRLVYNRLIDRRPVAIVQCADTGDILAAVQFGRDQRLPIAIRGGGQSAAGFAVCDDGLVIDLSRLRAVHVDAVSRVVRVEAGCRVGDLDGATRRFGLAVPTGIVSSTGIAGLALGGGSGYLTRQFGLTLDNLLKVEMVTADGRLVDASRYRRGDLFWALRGGGGNFGVVINLNFVAHPVDRVYGGVLLWPWEDALAVMAAYRHFLPAAPDPLGGFLALQTVPGASSLPAALHGQCACAIVVSYNGSADEGERVLKPLRRELPAPLFESLRMVRFASMQRLFDPFLPPGLHWYWRNDFVHTVQDAVLHLHRTHIESAPGELSALHLYPIDGAAHRVRKDATAWGGRDATWSMMIAGIDREPAKAPALSRWVRSYWEAVHPFNAAGGAVNFMMDDEADGRTQAAYGEHYPRLQAIKSRYDPDNLFRFNRNIRPAAARTA
jgi:FAD/FMN-containing dehydrogenase